MVDTASPPTAARASGAEASDPAPSSSARGIRPTMVASAVIRMGRMRMRADSTTARRSGWPSRRRWLAKSTSRIELETTMPTITMMPMKDSILSVVLVRYSVHITPIIPIGTANMMITGSRNERNCATITR